MKPTEEQIKEFWEWCNVDTECWNCKGNTSAYLIMGTCSVCKGTGRMKLHQLLELPPVDLNNLFKYAVPKLESKMPLAYWIICLIEDWAEGKNPDPVLALFWAIYEVIHETNT